MTRRPQPDPAPRPLDVLALFYAGLRVGVVPVVRIRRPGKCPRQLEIRL